MIMEEALRTLSPSNEMLDRQLSLPAVAQLLVHFQFRTRLSRRILVWTAFLSEPF